MMSKLKVDENGMLDFPQFLQLMEPVLKETDMEDDLLEAFQLFDKDKNGALSFSEFLTALQKKPFSAVLSHVPGGASVADVKQVVTD